MKKGDKTEQSGKTKHSSKKIDRRIRKTLKAIHSTAVLLFNSKSYNEITMEEIAEQSDISRATLYTHFRSKEEIYFTIGYERFKTFNETMKSLLHAPMTGFGTIITLCTNLLERITIDPTASRIVYLFLKNEKMLTVEAILDKQMNIQEIEEDKKSIEIKSMVNLLTQLRIFEETWSAIIQKGIDDHSITTSLEPIQLTHYLIIILNGIIDQMVVRDHILKKIDLKQEIIFSKTLQIIKQVLKS